MWISDLFIHVCENHSTVRPANINTIPTSLRLTILFVVGTNMEFVVGTYEVVIFSTELDKYVCY